ncbi:hypothetical protein Scep_012680 [Stephania cephalantha]|uniref:Uncharacterized protein n=1 Tax=Stephania cephalantha TaxID=152367 RepID=A0AAP0JFZ7_9MAGN
MDNHGGVNGVPRRRVREGGFEPMEVNSLDGWWRYSRCACSRRMSSRTAAPAGSAAGADDGPVETTSLRGGRPKMTTPARLLVFRKERKRREKRGEREDL